jgi:hypothetical protein
MLAFGTESCMFHVIILIFNALGVGGKGLRVGGAIDSNVFERLRPVAGVGNKAFRRLKTLG